VKNIAMTIVLDMDIASKINASAMTSGLELHVRKRLVLMTAATMEYVLKENATANQDFQEKAAQ
jgi:hypothetical protein